MDIWKLIAKTYLRVEIWATFLPHAGEHIIYYQAGRIQELQGLDYSLKNKVNLQECNSFASSAYLPS